MKTHIQFEIDANALYGMGRYAYIEKYCGAKTNKIPLLTIPYTEYNNIEQHISNFIKDLNI